MNNNQRVISQMVTAYAATELQQAMDGFKAGPNTENWKRLIRAMLIYQQERGLSEEERAEVIQDVASQSIGRWGDIIVTVASHGQSIDGILARYQL